MKKFLFLLSCVFLLVIDSTFASVRLPQMVRDSMILQRNAVVTIWGWASPHEKISISFLHRNYKTVADADGNWTITLSSLKAGGPYKMVINASNQIVLNDILVGDVWLCSGQSNMEHKMELHKYLYAQDIAAANYPGIRQFLVPAVPNLQHPEKDLSTGYWKSANPKDVLQFSAVAYFFAQKIYEKYHIPIGIINASVGGSPIEAWISEEGLQPFDSAMQTLNNNKDTAYVGATNRKALEVNKAWEQEQVDIGLTGSIKWYDPAYQPDKWYPISVPGYWEDQGIKDLDGVVWYRREINVPEAMTGIPARLFMGRIVDADFVYINGILAGSTSYLYPQRRYQLPAGLLKPGKNTIVIRVINYNGKGGFVPDKPYYIFTTNDTLELTGYWKYKVGAVFQPRQMPNVIVLPYQPAALYNSMIAPLTNYAIKGFLWYQGESNTYNANEYSKLLPALINDWRNHWQKNTLPFVFVQLPNFLDVNYLPSESQWAELREAQFKALSVPNTAMAVIIDLGEWNDVHPLNKKDVGIRSALAAEQVAYSDNGIVYSGPLYQSARKEGNKIIVTFKNIGGGMQSNDGEALRQFSIAGADKKFVWAQATISGNNVIVWNNEVADPMYVRYAWADNPRDANLYNKEGLPASPFRTDE